MDNHLRARKLGGKGTPRVPPKRSTQSPEIILRGLMSSYKVNNVDPHMAILNTDKNYIFQKPKLQSISNGKNCNAFVLTGKGEVQGDIPNDFEEAASQLRNAGVENGMRLNECEEENKQGVERSETDENGKQDVERNITTSLSQGETLEETKSELLKSAEHEDATNTLVAEKEYEVTKDEESSLDETCEKAENSKEMGTNGGKNSKRYD